MVKGTREIKGRVHGDNPQERDCECIRPRNLDRSRTFTSTIALIVIASLANVYASFLVHANQVFYFYTPNDEAVKMCINFLWNA